MSDDFEYSKETGGWTANASNSPISHGTRPIDDPINSPPHYKFGQYEVWDILTEWLKHAHLNFTSAMAWYQCMKYLFRFPFKGKARKDLLKAEWYFKKLLGEHPDE